MTAPMLPFEETVSEAAERMILERTRPNGVRCPCCTQLVSLRAVSISKSMAPAADWIHEVSTVPRQAMTFDKHSYGYKDEADRIKITHVLPFDLGPLLVGVPPYGGPGPPEPPRWPVG
ncbi:hypothetical protein LCGC14_0567980 [marine sediment metagenome]|uniref:Uncharacterized protein n=1 Tax=marine sediment metagenome TaxID=412755 RepID=A0A0F9UTC6_9ZZZZ